MHSLLRPLAFLSLLALLAAGCARGAGALEVKLDDGCVRWFEHGTPENARHQLRGNAMTATLDPHYVKVVLSSGTTVAFPRESLLHIGPGNLCPAEQ